MYRLIACQTSSSKVMVNLPLCDLYDYGIEVIESTSEIIEEVPTDQTYATVHATVNGMDEFELSDIMTTEL